jgi:hypothetical protein
MTIPILVVLAMSFAVDGSPVRRRLTSRDHGFWDLHARMTEWVMIGMPVEMAELMVSLAERPVPSVPDDRVRGLLEDLPGASVQVHPRGGFSVGWRGWTVEVEPFVPTPDPVFQDRLVAYRAEVASRPVRPEVVLRTVDVWAPGQSPDVDCVRITGLTTSSPWDRCP